jgi:hypothetical protein
MFIFLLLLSFSVGAHIIQDDVVTTDKVEFSFQKVCQKMVSHESPLIEVSSGTVLDCMGKKVSVGDFCNKELAHDPYYIRAYIDREKEKVVCHSGKKVLFRYLCVKIKDRKLCSHDAKVSCSIIQKKLARRLDLVHSSIINNDKGIKQLSCFFESLPLEEKANGSL